MVISRDIIRVTPFRALTTLLVTYLLSPPPLQAGFRAPSAGLRKRLWFLVGTGEWIMETMFWGLYRDYYRDQTGEAG